MPRILPLYRERPRNPVESEPARDCDAGCTRCWLSKPNKNLHNVCLPPEGDSGGLLVIDGYVSKHADTTGRPFSDRSGSHMRTLLRKLWDGPIAIDTAIKCYPGKVENVTDEVVKQCRGYLAATLHTVKPTKILVFGQEAMRVVLGRTVPPLSVRKGYSWVQVDGKPVPVYLFPRLNETLSNRFLRRWMEEDLEWALTTEPPFAPAWDGEARVVETLADAELAAADIREAGWFAYDVETAGRMWEAHQIVCASLCPASRDYAWVWADLGLKSKAIRQVMIDLLRDPKIGSVGSNMQYDEMSSMQDLKVRVRGVVGDTRLLRKILDADADADLETMAELVGMGGHKDEAKKALTDACRAVAKVAKDNAFDQIELIATRIRGLRPEVLASIKPGLRTKIWAYAFMSRDICITYNALDAVSTGRLHLLLNQRRKADSPNISRTYVNTVMPAAAAVRQVSEWGMLVDAGSIESFQMYLQGERAEVMRKLERYNGGPLNPNAYEDIRNLLFKKLGLKSMARTGAGKESTENAVLEAMRGQHRAVGLVLDWRKVSKLDGTYATGMMGHIRNDGRIHPTLKLDGARSGRLSCIAGWCLVRTKLGDVSIKGVCVGDYVWTHCQRWRRVTRTLRQGYKAVQDMRLSNGEVLTCTSDHKLLGIDGLWKEASAYASKHEMGQRAQGRSAETVPRPEELLYATDSQNAQHSIGKYHRIPETPYAGGRVRGVEVTEVFGKQTGLEESNVWQTRNSPPQLEGCVRRRSRLPDDLVGRQAQVSPPGCHDEGPRSEGFARRDGGAPYRRGPQKQCSGQPGACDEGGTPAHTLFTGEGLPGVVCTEVQIGGSIEVYDLTVEEDESFLVCGIFAHNCVDPNLQTIPRDSDSATGKLARDLFIAPPGHVMAQLDYSQVELRVAAMLSGDPLMKQLFIAGEDFHWATAKSIAPSTWGLTLDDTKRDGAHKQYRTKAKSVNFGLLYGQGDAALAEILGCSKRDAAKVRAGVLGQFKMLDCWIKGQLSEAKRTGYCWTYWEGQPARRRPLWKLADSDGYESSKAERGSWNSPIQGTAADYLLRSLTEAVNWILDEGLPAKLVLPVHDSIILEIEESYVDEVLEGVHSIMVGWDSQNVPLVVDVEVGPSWGSLEKYKLRNSPAVATTSAQGMAKENKTNG